MGIKNQGQSLKLVFLKYLITIALGLVGALALALLLLNLAYQLGWILPANYTEGLLLEKKAALATEAPLDPSLLPENTSYLLLKEEGQVLASTMEPETQAKALAFYQGQGLSQSSLSFMAIKRPQETLLVAYSLAPAYTQPWMEDHLPSIDRLFMALVLVLSFLLILAITLFFASYLKGQLQPILEASEKISKRDLDFDLKGSQIKEFNGVLESLGVLKKDLRASLQENWAQEDRRRRQVAALAHDIKTPLAIIGGNAELLETSPLTPDQGQYVRFIRKNIQRISAYTQALMDLGQARPKESLDLKEVPLDTLADQVYALAQEVTDPHPLNLEYAPLPGPGRVEVDMGALEKAFLNVLTNALTYAPENSTLSLQVASQGSFLEIALLDQGPGFSKEDLAQGQEEFYQGDKSRHAPHHYGLGLYIASQILQAHGGHLRLANRTDQKGARVSLFIPLL